MTRKTMLRITRVVVVAVLCPIGASNGDTIVIDDFNDGNDDGWTPMDFTVTPCDVCLATFDASLLEYNIFSCCEVSAGVGGLVSWWDASLDPFYSEGFVRAKVRANTQGTSLTLRMRGSTGIGYDFVLSTNLHVFGIVRVNPGPDLVLGTIGPEIASPGLGERWFMEAGAIGDQLTLKVWLDGTLQPDCPQLRVTDSFYSVGQLAVTGSIPSTNVDAQIDFTFDEIFFCPPPPAPCPWDLDCDGIVGINDFLDLLAAWGPNPGHPADFDGDGIVGITDFLALLANWGPCP